MTDPIVVCLEIVIINFEQRALEFHLGRPGNCQSCLENIIVVTPFLDKFKQSKPNCPMRIFAITLQEVLSKEMGFRVYS